MVPSDESQTDVCSNQPSFFKQDTQQGLGMFVMLGEPLPTNVTDWYHSKGTPQ